MIAVFVAGRYSATIQYPGESAKSLGIMQSDGFAVYWTKGLDVVDDSDAYGSGTTIEAFYQGINMGVSAVAKEWIDGVIESMNKFNGWAGTGASTFSLGVIGQAETDKAGVLVLSATAGTPAATSPATMTFTYAMQNQDEIKFNLSPKHRTVALNFRIYPYLSSTVKFFTST